MNVLSPPTSIKSYNATKTRWISVWKCCKCLNWRDVFLCPEVNVGEREAQSAGRLLAATSSYIQGKTYKELFLLSIKALSSSDISRKGFHPLSGISLNYRTNKFGRDLWKSLLQCPAYGKGRWDCSRLCPLRFGCAGWGIHQLSRLLFQSLTFLLNIHIGDYIRNLAAVKVINICQGWFQKTNQRGSVCPQFIFLPFMAMGMGSRRACSIHPCPQTSGVAVLFIPATNPLQSEFVLSKVILKKWVQVTLASSWLGCFHCLL